MNNMDGVNAKGTPQFQRVDDVGKEKLSGIEAKVNKALQEPMIKLKESFQKGSFIRTFSDQNFELDVIKGKQEHEKDLSKADKFYWSSTSVVQEGIPCKIWEGEDPRCGLMISSEAELGGWGAYDMGTPNVPKEIIDPEEIQGYFPSHFPDIVAPPLLKRLKGNDTDLAAKILNRDPEKTGTGHCQQAENYLIERLDSNHPEHKELLDRLPVEFKTSNDMDDIRVLMAQLKASSGGNVQEYNEGKVHYTPRDLLGVVVFNNPASIAKGKELQERLANTGIALPFVTYQQKKGAIEIFEDAKDVPTVSQELKSMIPEADSEDLKALAQNFYSIAEENDAPAGTAEEFVEWFKDVLQKGSVDLSKEDKKIIADPEFLRLASLVVTWRV